MVEEITDKMITMTEARGVLMVSTFFQFSVLIFCRIFSFFTGKVRQFCVFYWEGWAVLRKCY